MSQLKLPGFEIIEKIGQGGMATVWKARQISLDRVVAIKMLSSQRVHDASDVQRFQSEAQQAAKLKHPGIIQVYDANALNGVYYFVMEYVAGYTVGDWVRRKGRLTEDNALLVADSVADALDYAWQAAKIIHCDIKPDNVMVDADGTVKVADLGLSRTLNAMARQEVSDEVMGTPAYISPEQAMGEPDLDCRADIYSMGAMLYHLVTGQLLFQGETEDKVMELQVSGKVPDPLELNPTLSRNIGWLIEKMLAKKREHRHKDWAEVRADVARIRKGLPIHPPLPPEGSSTVTRSAKRVRVPAQPLGLKDTRQSGLSLMTRVALGAGVVVLVAFALARWSARTDRPAAAQKPKAPASASAVPAAAPAPVVSDQNAKEMFDFVKLWVDQNPLQYDEGILRYRKVAEQTKGTPYTLKAEDEMKRIAGLRAEAVERVMRRLGDETAGMLREKRVEDAARVYEGYAGLLARETASRRQAMAKELRDNHKVMEEERQSREAQAALRYNEFLDQVASALVTGGITGATARVAAAGADERLASRRPALDELRTYLTDAAQVDRRVMESFRSSIGQEVAVALNDGVRKLSIQDVRDGKAVGQQKIEAGGAAASITFSFESKDLSPKERLARMGPDDQPEVALVKGLMAFASKAFPHARRYFGLTHPLLSERLTAAVDAAEKGMAGDEARTAFLGLLKSMGLPADPYDRDACLADLAEKRFSAEAGRKLLDQVAGFRARYGSLPFSGECEPLLRAIEAAAQRKDEAAPPPPRPADRGAVLADPDEIKGKLLDRNPDLGKGEIQIASEGGGIRRIEIVSQGVRDITPLGSVEVRELACGAVGQQNRWRQQPICDLADLSPLRGGVLESLFVGLARVRDLSPLKGLPLRKLHLRNCPVADLSPLKEVPSLEELEVRKTDVKDLTPLRGLTLRHLDVSGSRVVELRALAGMPLQHLNVSETQVKDLSVIKDMPLTELDISGTRVFDFSALKGMPLRRLRMDDTQFKDLSLLRGMPLSELSLANTPVTDITVLKDMPLLMLSLAGCAIKDLGPLAGMKLRDLNVSGSRLETVALLSDMALERLDISMTRVQDLSGLAGMPLGYLNISGTRVRDLKPLIDTKLRHLEARNVAVNNWEPLRRMPLRSLCVDDPEGSIRAVLRAMPDLEEVNWSRYER